MKYSLLVTFAGRRRGFGVVCAVCGLLTICGWGCRSTQGPEPPVAFMFPTLYSPRILKTMKPVPVSSAQIETLLNHIGLAPGLHREGLLERELQVVARSLTDRGYAELDARHSNGKIRWVSFRGIQRKGAPAPVLVVAAGYWSHPVYLKSFDIDTRKAPVESWRTDPYGVPQKVETWQGTGEFFPRLLKVLNGFDGKLDHWELEVTVSGKALAAMKRPIPAPPAPPRTTGSSGR